MIRGSNFLRFLCLFRLALCWSKRSIVRLCCSRFEHVILVGIAVQGLNFGGLQQMIFCHFLSVCLFRTVPLKCKLVLETLGANLNLLPSCIHSFILPFCEINRKDGLQQALTNLCGRNIWRRVADIQSQQYCHSRMTNNYLSSYVILFSTYSLYI